MKNCHAVALLACLTAVGAGRSLSAAVEISVSPRDYPSDATVRQYEDNVYTGAWNTGNIYVSDISIDPVTGDIYALTASGIQKRTASNGYQNLGIIGAPTNQGGDLEVYNGLISVSRTDSGDAFVRQWDTNNENAYSNWDTGDPDVSDISVDPVTGELYALTRRGIRKQTATNGVQNLGLAFPPANTGGDLEVYNGVISVSLQDFGYAFVRQWDTNNGNAYSVWDTGDPNVSDISVDPNTGVLYALTGNGIRKQLAGNGVQYLGLTSAPTNYGGDLEVYSTLPDADGAVPEPTSMFVWILLSVFGLIAHRHWQGRA